MDDFFFPIIIVGMLFIAFPWIIFHYVTKWKTAATITNEAEQLLDDLHTRARRLDERMETIERIMAADDDDALPSPTQATALQALRDQGVKMIFGYPGGAALHIYDALFRQPTIVFILNFGFLYKIFIHFIKLSPTLNLVKTLIKKFHSTESKAF